MGCVVDVCGCCWMCGLVWGVVVDWCDVCEYGVVVLLDWYICVLCRFVEVGRWVFGGCVLDWYWFVNVCCVRNWVGVSCLVSYCCLSWNVCFCLGWYCNEGELMWISFRFFVWWCLGWWVLVVFVLWLFICCFLGCCCLCGLIVVGLCFVLLVLYCLCVGCCVW